MFQLSRSWHLRALLGGLLAALLALSVVGTAAGAAGSKYGSANCYRQGYIWSRAGVQVEHHWSGGQRWYYTPYHEYRETGPISGLTWYVVEWDHAWTSAGAYCTGG